MGVSVSDAKVTVNGNDITISANINGTYVPYSFSNADTHPEIGEAIKNGTWGVAESTTTAAASLKNGNGVIKLPATMLVSLCWLLWLHRWHHGCCCSQEP